MFWRKKDAKNKETAAAASTDGDGDSVNILRFMQESCMCMELQFQPSEVPDEETENQREKRLLHDKESVLQELADLMDASGQINNPTKFYKDMVNRERKATTAIAPGIAIPHVRSMQVKSFIMGFARAPGEGFYFDSLDGAPTKLFFMLASPPYEDKTYLKVYRQFAEMVSQEWVVDAFLDAETPQDILNVLRGFIRS